MTKRSKYRTPMKGEGMITQEEKFRIATEMQRPLEPAKPVTEGFGGDVTKEREIEGVPV